MPTKPEGPAQEPQACNCHWIYDDGAPFEPCSVHPTTPAPSKPAGAREQAAIHLVSEAFSAFLEMTNGKPELDTRWMREAEELLCGGSPLAQQTAAKDAAIGRLERDLAQSIATGNENGEKAEYWCNTAEAAERERDSLRDALADVSDKVQRLKMYQPVGIAQFRRALREAIDAAEAALKSGKE